MIEFEMKKSLHLNSSRATENYRPWSACTMADLPYFILQKAGFLMTRLVAFSAHSDIVTKSFVWPTPHLEVNTHMYVELTTNLRNIGTLSTRVKNNFFVEYSASAELPTHERSLHPILCLFVVAYAQAEFAFNSPLIRIHCMV